MKMNVFDYIILEHPADPQTDDTVIVEQGRLLAKDQQSLSMKLILETVPRLKESGREVDLDRLEVTIRPF